MSYELNDKQKAQLNKPFAVAALSKLLRPIEVHDGYHLSGLEKVIKFHERVELPVRYDWSYIPPVSERILRAKLLLEEMLETFEAMGLRLGHRDYHGFEDSEFSQDNLEIVHIEGSRYDPIETADGLADIKVIANGTAACFGIPQDDVDHEVWASNMTKVGEDGKPIVNRCAGKWDMDDPMKARFCSLTERGIACDEPTHLIDPTQPVGKVLKPATYCPANIARLFVEDTTKKEEES